MISWHKLAALMLFGLAVLSPGSVLAGTWQKQGPTYSGSALKFTYWEDEASHTLSMNTTATVTFTWQPNDPNNPAADPPPAKVNTREVATATWFAHVNAVAAEGFPNPWSCSGNADNGMDGTYIPTGSVAEGSVGGEHTGMRLREEVNSSSGVVTCSTTLTADFTAQCSYQTAGGGGILSGTYDAFIYEPHHHPTNYRQHSGKSFADARLEFEYRWDSTSGLKASDGVSNVDLSHIYIGEYVKYPGNANPFIAQDPPFYNVYGNWSFNNPTVSPNTSSRNGNNGTIPDFHFGGSGFRHPHAPTPESFTATQKYRFHCDLCMNPGEYKDIMSGLTITRKVESLTTDFENGPWEFSVRKSGLVGKKPVIWDIQ